MLLRSSLWPSICLASFSMAGLLGCSPSNELGVVLSNPPPANISELGAERERRTVYLKGKVVARAPFLNGGAYQLQDETGTVWVLTQGPLPKLGQEVAVEGRVEYQPISIGDGDWGELYLVEAGQGDPPPLPRPDPRDFLFPHR